MRIRLISCIFVLLVVAVVVAADSPARKARIGDITSIEGVRDNPLIGYGLVVGLNGSGDRRQTIFTTQMLANIMQKMGLQIPAQSVRVNNIAAVMVTTTLPPFARPGMKLDLTVSSIGDAKSLEGGLLLLTPLRAADGQVYAEGQGALTIAGYSASTGQNTRQVNHPTVGRVPAGGLVERETGVDLGSMGVISLLLRDPDFAVVREMAEAINGSLGAQAATPLDARRLEIDLRRSNARNVPELMAGIQDLQITVRNVARVVVNERTGTIVLGREVRLSPVSILHGNFSVEISTSYSVSQPQPFAHGETAVIPEQNMTARESPARRMELQEGATVEQLVTGLQSIGATARDVIAILQAMKAAGALQAELEVL